MRSDSIHSATSSAVGRHVLEVVGAVEVGRAVHVGGADALERLEVVVVEVLASR